MTERFTKAYNALVRSFFEGTLAKGTCVACACGNIIADSLGVKLTHSNLTSINIEGYHAYNVWGIRRFFDSQRREYQSHPWYIGVVNSAGYTTEEFAKIENAFELNTEIDYKCYDGRKEQEILEDQYKGLCAVVDVLIQLDEGKEDPDELKKKFREHPKLQVA